MRTALRGLAAVVAGFVAASLVMMGVEATNGHLLYPALAKAAEGVRDREALRALLAQAPVGALLVVLAGWALGGLTGGWVSTRVARAARGPVFVVGALLTLSGVANNLMIPPPLWFWGASLAVLPLAVVGGARLALRSGRPGR